MKSALYKSLALHIVVLLLFLTDLTVFWRRNMVLEQVPIIVDLEQVKISEMTNLPEKAKVTDKQNTLVKKSKPRPVIKPDPKPEIKSDIVEKAEPESQPKEEIKPIKKDFVVPPQPKRPEIKKKKEEKKTKPVVKEKPKQKPQQKKKAQKVTAQKPPKKEVKSKPQVSALKNLMDSVNEIEKKVDAKEQKATIEKGAKVAHTGIEGGTGGSYFSDLTISDTDAIAAWIRRNWNLDPGARGVEDMVIEIKAYLNKDGSVSDVKIVDMARYRSDGHFRAVANSARVAVYKSQPFTVLTQKYASKYEVWKVMRLRFNPLSQTVY